MNGQVTPSQSTLAHAGRSFYRQCTPARFVASVDADCPDDQVWDLYIKRAGIQTSGNKVRVRMSRSLHRDHLRSCAAKHAERRKMQKVAAEVVAEEIAAELGKESRQIVDELKEQGQITRKRGPIRKNTPGAVKRAKAFRGGIDYMKLDPSKVRHIVLTFRNDVPPGKRAERLQGYLNNLITSYYPCGKKDEDGNLLEGEPKGMTFLCALEPHASNLGHYDILSYCEEFRHTQEEWTKILKIGWCRENGFTAEQVEDIDDSEPHDDINHQGFWDQESLKDYRNFYRYGCNTRVAEDALDVLGLIWYPFHNKEPETYNLPGHGKYYPSRNKSAWPMHPKDSVEAPPMNAFVLMDRLSKRTGQPIKHLNYFTCTLESAEAVREEMAGIGYLMNDKGVILNTEPLPITGDDALAALAGYERCGARLIVDGEKNQQRLEFMLAGVPEGVQVTHVGQPISEERAYWRRTMRRLNQEEADKQWDRILEDARRRIRQFYGLPPIVMEEAA